MIKFKRKRVQAEEAIIHLIPIRLSDK